jgi:hypothetical protein
MVTVQMSDSHRIDCAGVQPLGLERHQAGGAAIDQQYLTLAGQVDARLPSPATTERVPTARELNPHVGILTYPAQTATAAPRRWPGLGQPQHRSVHEGCVRAGYRTGSSA